MDRRIYGLISGYKWSDPVRIGIEYARTDRHFMLNTIGTYSINVAHHTLNSFILWTLWIVIGHRSPINKLNFILIVFRSCWWAVLNNFQHLFLYFEFDLLRCGSPNWIKYRLSSVFCHKNYGFCKPEFWKSTNSFPSNCCLPFRIRMCHSW